MEKIKLKDLVDNPNWQKAVIVYKQENFKKSYTETERSYVISNGQWGLDSSKMGRCIVGSCLDGTDKNIRLDCMGWEIEYCYILEENT